MAVFLCKFRDLAHNTHIKTTLMCDKSDLKIFEYRIFLENVGKCSRLKKEKKENIGTI